MIVSVGLSGVERDTALQLRRRFRVLAPILENYPQLEMAFPIVSFKRDGRAQQFFGLDLPIARGQQRFCI